MSKTKNKGKMNQSTDNPILILEKPFKTTVTVVCGWCKGRKVIQIQEETETCPYCLGEGLLSKVTEGTMKLYTNKSF
jgi:uncharacterized CHY-type Zn-finger protein